MIKTNDILLTIWLIAFYVCLYNKVLARDKNNWYIRLIIVYYLYHKCLQCYIGCLMRYFVNFFIESCWKVLFYLFYLFFYLIIKLFHGILSLITSRITNIYFFIIARYDDSKGHFILLQRYDLFKRKIDKNKARFLKWY